jgi:hypothetical protein
MHIQNKLSVGIIIGFGILTSIFCVCGGEKEKTEIIPEYDGWEKYSYQHFIYHYPKDSYWGKHMDQFSAAFEKYLKEDCEFLAMEIPDDTIHFFIHNSNAEGEELTGRELPFHTENQIHWDRVPPFGTELARFLIDKMSIRRTDYEVLYEGLATLRDYSGSDYHSKTAMLIEMNRFIPLDSLINNESFARMNEREKNIEAASLVAFITYNWGINRFKLLWQSASPFEESVEQLFGTDMETFEDNWMTFAGIRFKGMVSDTLYFDSVTAKEVEKKR